MGFSATRLSGTAGVRILRLTASLLFCSRLRRFLQAAFCFGFVCLLISGCLSKVLEIRSEPSGATVYINGAEKGQTPVDYEFDHYGPREITMTKEGYRTLTEDHTVRPSWWACFPFDLFVEIWPFQTVDVHRFSRTLKEAGGEGEELDSLFSGMRKAAGKLVEEN